jgi:glutathione-regulated potassium-efflux system ancillary protein KefG
MVAIEDLIDAHGVAEVLDLSHYNTVSVYQRRYPDMPRPAVDLGKGRIKLWLKPDVEQWAAAKAVASRRRSQRPR